MQCILCICRKKDSAAHADAVTMGDVWLAPAIQAGLVQPIPDAQHSAWWVSGSYQASAINVPIHKYKQ